MIIVMGLMIMLAAMSVPTVLKMIRQSAVHSAAGDIINAWNLARSLAMDQVVIDTPGKTLSYYGIEIVQQPGQQAYVGVIYDNRSTSAINANPSLSLYVDPTTSRPVMRSMLNRTVLVANGVGAPPTVLNGTLAVYAQYGIGVPIDPGMVSSNCGTVAPPVGLGIPGNTIANIPASTISTALSLQTIDYSSVPPVRGYAVNLALYPVGVFAELN